LTEEQTVTCYLSLFHVNAKENNNSSSSSDTLVCDGGVAVDDGDDRSEMMMYGRKAPDVFATSSSKVVSSLSSMFDLSAILQF
jgi:hypothetical protein